MNSPDTLMPLLFVGHGSPMNAVEDNEFSARWRILGERLPKPEAVLCVSAHWLRSSISVTSMENPGTIHDFQGFPEALYQVDYPAPGHPVLAQMVKDSLVGHDVILDQKWGLDHGAWSILCHMYPKADVPVVQLSFDARKPAEFHYGLAKKLALLRNEGVLILGSGNVVHNLSKMNFYHQGGYDWAIDVHESIKRKVKSSDHQGLIDYLSMGPEAKLAIPTPDHYFPLLYVLANVIPGEPISLFNDSVVMGSISMLSVLIGASGVSFD